MLEHQNSLRTLEKLPILFLISLKSMGKKGWIMLLISGFLTLNKIYTRRYLNHEI